MDPAPRPIGLRGSPAARVRQPLRGGYGGDATQRHVQLGTIIASLAATRKGKFGSRVQVVAVIEAYSIFWRWGATATERDRRIRLPARRSNFPTRSRIVLESCSNRPRIVLERAPGKHPRIPILLNPVRSAGASAGLSRGATTPRDLLSTRLVPATHRFGSGVAVGAAGGEADACAGLSFSISARVILKPGAMGRVARSARNQRPHSTYGASSGRAASSRRRSSKTFASNVCGWTHPRLPVQRGVPSHLACAIPMAADALFGRATGRVQLTARINRTQFSL